MGKYFVKLSKNQICFANQSLFYSAAPQYGQRIRVTRMQRQQVVIKIKMKMIIKMNENGDGTCVDDDVNNANSNGHMSAI